MRRCPGSSSYTRCVVEMLTNAHIGNSLSIHLVLESQCTLSPSISADTFDLLRLQGLSRYGSHEYACKRLSGYKEGCCAIVATATSVQCPPSPVSPARQHRSSSRFCSTEPSFRGLHRLALPVAFSVNYSVSIPLRHTFVLTLRSFNLPTTPHTHPHIYRHVPLPCRLHHWFRGHCLRGPRYVPRPRSVATTMLSCSKSPPSSCRSPGTCSTPSPRARRTRMPLRSSSRSLPPILPPPPTQGRMFQWPLRVRREMTNKRTLRSPPFPPRK